MSRPHCHDAHVEAWELFEAGVEPAALAVLSDAECIEAVRASACGIDKDAGVRAVHEAARRKWEQGAQGEHAPRAVPC